MQWWLMEDIQSIEKPESDDYIVKHEPDTLKTRQSFSDAYRYYTWLCIIQSHNFKRGAERLVRDQLDAACGCYFYVAVRQEALSSDCGAHVSTIHLYLAKWHAQAESLTLFRLGDVVISSSSGIVLPLTHNVADESEVG